VKLNFLGEIMENNANLFNAAVIGENSESAFLVDGNHLHAVEKSVADQKKEKSNPKQTVPLIREALKALIKFSQGKVESHFFDVDWKAIANQRNEEEFLVEKIHSIYSHLPHHDRIELSSHIHHKQSAS
jgi:hypothetical protein